MLATSYLKQEFQASIAKTREIWSVDVPNIKESTSDLQFILKCLKKNQIKIGPGKATVSDNIVKEEIEAVVEPKVPKKRGRPRNVSAQEHNRSESSESVSNDDSVSSTASSRSRRAAAQAAEHKMANVQSLMKATKLRRPTDFDERESKRGAVVSSPPTKCRRTHQKSAGSSSSGSSPRENVDHEVQIGKLVDKICIIDVKRMTTPEVKSYTKRNKSRSSEKICGKRKSEDIFNESPVHIEMANKISIKGTDEIDSEITEQRNNNSVEGTVTKNLNSTNPVKKKEEQKKRFRGQKIVDSGIGSIEGEIHQLGKENPPKAQSSPVQNEPSQSEGEFNGFNISPLKSDTIGKQKMVLRGNTFVKENKETEVVETKTEEIRLDLIKKEVNTDKEESSDEIIEIETSKVKSRTKVIRKKENKTEMKETGQEEKENQEDEPVVVDLKQDESPTLRSRTKVIKKVAQPREVEKSSDEELQVRDNQRTNKKMKSESPEINFRSRTKTIRKKTESEEDKKNSSEEESSLRSRTKTMRKGVQSNNAIEELNSKYLTSEFKLPVVRSNNQIKKTVPESSKSPAGELVKKRVEGFEKLKKEEVQVELTGRFTRNAVRNKAVSSSSTESRSAKQNRGEVQLTSCVQKAKREPLVKGKQNMRKENKENVGPTKVASAGKVTSAESHRVTPLAINNRLTPGIGSNQKLLVVNKGLSSATRQTPVEINTAVVQKPVSEEVEKKKEEERLRHEAKEVEAKKKKEKALKASADTNRRKREEKIQRAAAARDAAEKEKAMLAAKAEKEKEEKLRQMAAEKEKQKEEHLKKKLLMQQKAQEHEERRKQDEAARLAKLKEQEEEHKRVLAIKEREREILKQKAAELKLAEAEKAKHQAAKLVKVVAINNAKLQAQQGTTPSVKTNGVQPPVQSYEITPARDERPLLKPKTKDDYGIDDAKSDDSSDDECRPKKEIPGWAQPKYRARLLKTVFYLPEEYWPMFMEANTHPDINQLFAGNHIKKRIRTSSAVWNTPPMSFT